MYIYIFITTYHVYTIYTYIYMHTHLGKLYTSGFAMRPAFPFQDWVYEILQPFLRDHQGQSFTDLPELDLITTDDFYRVLQTDLRGAWKTRSMATRRKMKEMRQSRLKPPHLINFGSQS